MSDTPMRRARIAAGLSLSEVCRRAGQHTSAISRFETGKGSLSAEAIFAYAQVVMPSLARELAPVMAAMPKSTRKPYGPRRKSAAGGKP